jgi:hypothetical protein
LKKIIKIWTWRKTQYFGVGKEKTQKKQNCPPPPSPPGLSELPKCKIHHRRRQCGSWAAICIWERSKVLTESLLGMNKGKVKKFPMIFAAETVQNLLESAKSFRLSCLSCSCWDTLTFFHHNTLFLIQNETLRSYLLPEQQVGLILTKNAWTFVKEQLKNIDVVPLIKMTRELKKL